MISVILKCLEETIISHHGLENWGRVLDDAGVSRDVKFVPSIEVDDVTMSKIFKSVCNVLQLSIEEVTDAYGDYWVNVYTQKIYGPFYEGRYSISKFFRYLDGIHDSLERTLPGTIPQRFMWKWLDQQTLVFGDQIRSELVELIIALAKGVGKYSGEQVEVKVLRPGQVRMRFI